MSHLTLWKTVKTTHFHIWPGLEIWQIQIENYIILNFRITSNPQSISIFELYEWHILKVGLDPNSHPAILWNSLHLYQLYLFSATFFLSNICLPNIVSQIFSVPIFLLKVGVDNCTFLVPHFFCQIFFLPIFLLKVGVDPNSHLALPRIPLRAICTNPKAGEILIHPQPLGQERNIKWNISKKFQEHQGLQILELLITAGGMWPSLKICFGGIILKPLFATLADPRRIGKRPHFASYPYLTRTFPRWNMSTYVKSAESRGIIRQVQKSLSLQPLKGLGNPQPTHPCKVKHSLSPCRAVDDTSPVMSASAFGPKENVIKIYQQIQLLASCLKGQTLKDLWGQRIENGCSVCDQRSARSLPKYISGVLIETFSFDRIVKVDSIYLKSLNTDEFWTIW